MAEGARLESVYTLKGIEGSNPSLSADRTNFRNEVGFFISRRFLNMKQKKKTAPYFFLESSIDFQGEIYCDEEKRTFSSHSSKNKN